MTENDHLLIVLPKMSRNLKSQTKDDFVTILTAESLLQKNPIEQICTSYTKVSYRC